MWKKEGNGDLLVKKRFLILLMAVMLLVLLSCDNSSSSLNADTYLIVTDANFAPFEFKDENDNYTGIDMDILAAIAQDQGFSYKLHSLSFEAAMGTLETRQADGMISGMSITEERALKYDFSEPYYDSGLVFAAADASAYQSGADLQGQTIAVKMGTEGARYAEAIQEQYNFSLKYFNSSELMYKSVLNGEVAACLEDYPVIGYVIKQGSGLKMVGGILEESSYGFAVLKDCNGELLQMFNEGLRNIKADGTYQQIIDKYIAF